MKLSDKYLVKIGYQLKPNTPITITQAQLVMYGWICQTEGQLEVAIAIKNKKLIETLNKQLNLTTKTQKI